MATPPTPTTTAEPEIAVAAVAAAASPDDAPHTPPPVQRSQSRPPCETCGAVAAAIVTDERGARRAFCKPCVQVQQALFEKQMREQLESRQSAAPATAVVVEEDSSNSWRERARRAQATLLASLSSSLEKSSPIADETAESATTTTTTSPGEAGDDADDDGFFSSMFLKARESMDQLRRSSVKPLASSAPGTPQAAAVAAASPQEVLAKLAAAVSETVMGLPRALFVARIVPLVVSEQRDIERLALVDRATFAAITHEPPSGWLLHLRDSLQSTERCPSVRRFSRFDGIVFDRVMFHQPFSTQALQTRCLGGGSFKALCDVAHQAAQAKAAGRAAPESMLQLTSIDLSACQSARDLHWREASPFEKLHCFASLRTLALGTLELGTHERFWTLLALATSLVSIDAGLMAAPMDDVRALSALPALQTLHIRARDWPAAVVAQLPARLKKLVLRGGTIDLRALASLADTCTQLDSLAASAVLTAAASPALSRLLKNGLQALELRAASTPEAAICVARTIALLPSNALESLVLGDVGEDGDQVAEALLKCAALRRFSASFAEPSAADAALDAMNQAKLTQLRALQIVRATDYGVKALKKFGANLAALNLAGCTLVTQSGLVAALANTHALTSLNVSDIPQAGAALARLAPQLTQLRELVMENCGAGNEALEALGAHCARLEIVSLSRTEKATSPAVAGALLQWRQLHTLRVASCSAMDDSLLATIASCLTGLRQLTLSDRSGVSSLEILYHMDELRELVVVQALSESLEPEPLRLFSAKAQEALLRNSRNRKLMISVIVNK